MPQNENVITLDLLKPFAVSVAFATVTLGSYIMYERQETHIGMLERAIFEDCKQEFPVPAGISPQVVEAYNNQEECRTKAHNEQVKPATKFKKAYIAGMLAGGAGFLITPYTATYISARRKRQEQANNAKHDTHTPDP